jgi:phenylalanyl-tRNA synthetase alpha subunit
MTKLMNKFVETYELLKQAQESHDEVKDVLKDKINESFTEELKFVTRIINTVKYAFTFSKYTKAKEETSEVVDYKAAMNEMMEIFPDIKDGLKEIIKKHTEIKKVVKKEISGSIKYTHVTLNEGLSDILKGLITKLEGIFSSLYRSLKTIGGRIDDKFEKIDSLLKG